jgi:hypothetical protein
VGYGGEICLTTEGLDEVIACASGGKTSCFLPTHVIAVRDFKLRKLYIYINGRKTAEADETGSGEFPPKTSTLSVSYETWSVQYMSGLLNSVKIYERAFSDDEIKQCFSK